MYLIFIIVIGEDKDLMNLLIEKDQLITYLEGLKEFIENKVNEKETEIKRAI